MVDQTPRCDMQQDGTKIWHTDGKVHRLDGPAIEYPDGSKFYFQDNKLNRTNGPALEYHDGHVGWHLNGIEYTFDQFLELTTCSPETKCMLKLQYG